MDYSKLIQFATVRQIEFIEAIEKAGSQSKAAKALGVNQRTMERSLSMLRTRAAVKGWSPEHDFTHPVPPGQMLRGVSTYYDPDGKIKGQWVMTKADSEAQEALLREFANSLAETVKGLAPLTPPPPASCDDLMVVIPMGDPHFGMHAWKPETGADFDLQIAERMTCGAIDRLVSSAPSAHTACLLNLGDMFHADNQKNTSQSGHQLDVDGRWTKVQQVGLRAMIYCARRMLEKYQKVVLRFNKGNHDGHSSYALALMMSCYFHNEPRIEVDLSPAAVWYFEFGKCLIGSTHGDTIPGKAMIPVMAADMPEAWGRTKHRHFYVGHVHHKDVKEYPGGIVEYVRTITPRDAWHSGQGYRAGQDMGADVWHKEHGIIERHRVDVSMLQE